MLSSLLLVVMTQFIPCSPYEMSPACHCKQGIVTACVVLAADDARKAADVLDEVVGALEAMEQGLLMAGEGDKDKKKLQAAAQSLSQSLRSAEPPYCKGQQHHPISRLIAKKLAQHSTLKGLFQPRDPRFVTRAKDEKAHCGYQEWHRKVDKEVINWLDKHSKATPEEFIAKLREIYSRPELKARFPHGF